MVVAVTAHGNNPFQPGFTSESYVPDQLIAGNLKLVTANIQVVGNLALKRGTLMGAVTAGSVVNAVAASGNVGNGTFGAPSAGTGAKPGTYGIRFTGPTTFVVTDPFGTVLPAVGAGYGGTVGSPDVTIAFTAHSSAMVAGDSFQFGINSAGTTYKGSVSAAGDGSQTPTCVLADDVAASTLPQTAGVYLMGEFNARSLIYGTGLTRAGVEAGLRALGIFIKDSVSASDPT